MQFFRGDYYSTRKSCVYPTPTRSWLIIGKISWIDHWPVGDHMPSDPKYCLAEAVRCIELARRARTLEGRQTFQNLAEKWKGLAADIERAEASLEELNETGFSAIADLPVRLTLTFRV